MSDKKLLPCPFCGGNATISKYPGFYMARCLKCGVETNVFAMKEQAVDAWNTRTNTIPVGNGQDYEVTHNDR